MSIDSRAFRQAAAQFATGVTVIAFEVEGAVRALTANSFTSLSLSPPLVLFCIEKKSSTGRLIQSASSFCVSILGDDQRDLSAYFAGIWRGATVPRHKFTLWEGTHRLDGCMAALACKVHEIHEGGDHWIVVGEVVGLYRSDHECRPLVFYAGGYVKLEAPCVKLEDAPLGIAWGP